jgi:hypothetical protein
MTYPYRRYARQVGITGSLKELRHYSAIQLLAGGTGLNTVAGLDDEIALPWLAEFAAVR